jgi:hypothetical protein
MLKDDLVSALDDKLRANPSAYVGNPVFNEFYQRGGSPVKKERHVASTMTVDGEAKPQRKRRQTLKVKEELDSPYVALFTCAPLALRD